ncbi:Uncharacterised protein [Bacillus freudenreichii]|nr:Uncharacterised protein [Bacillus freudenreichii]
MLFLHPLVSVLVHVANLAAAVYFQFIILMTSMLKQNSLNPRDIPGAFVNNKIVK